MLTESRLLSFLHPKENYLLHFFEGQKLIHDLALIHSMSVSGFSYFRDAVLTLVPMISLLKNKEALGLYIDSEQPLLRLKVEANYLGLVRTLLLPEDLASIPEKLTGKARLNKILPEGSSYNSIIELSDIHFHEIINKILQESYQLHGQAFLGNLSDQSILLTQLPVQDVNKVEQEERHFHRYVQNERPHLQKILDQAMTAEEDIKQALAPHGFNFLSEKTVKFFCGCSRNRMIDHLWAMKNTSHDELFGDKNTLEVKCDYCMKTYEISREDLTRPEHSS